MTETDIQRMVAHLKLLANEPRLKLLGLVTAQERSVGELAEIMELKEPTVSHHLSRLSEAGLVTMRREGNVHFYALDADRLRQLSRDLFTPEKVTRLAEQADTGAWERKVLRTYLDGERLTKIPDVRKKRDVVLAWLADRFEHGRRYPEREVNEIIGRHHPDFATLRRELIGARLMEREGGIYWRTGEVASGAAAAA
ncbi:MAG TPA: metalloregulator ArsR/SmtB family transcription factor [Longimicrobium sp.]|nr:metalloregulator ArsR/SmtB family transcription factor [Longimicrobium sp.]